jgi:acetyl-CoA carboxylase biotin carboxylase subunit
MESYLKVDTIISAAIGTNADAVHPGYGFLAEQPELAERCAEFHLIFVGPSADSIRKMGDKLLARELAKELGIPVIPGSEVVRNLKEAMIAARKVGYPILLKAAAGGGGRGMKIVKRPNELSTVFDEASAETRAAFGDDRLYVEHFVLNARHLEVQLLGDYFGNVIHLGERDCSLQRRYQKIIEEAPSPVVSAELREEICKAALAIANYIQYENAGTVEFILDQDDCRLYFLEMNTRIQVEHPVTEMITGVDLVKKQIEIANGQPLGLQQEDVQLNGHAIECRINAESVDQGFQPCPGQIKQWVTPEGLGTRIDSHCYPGYFVPPYYDSLLAKIITKGNDRPQAIERMQNALASFTVHGVDTTTSFHQLILQNPDYRNGKVNTRWIEDILIKRGQNEGHQLR